MGGSFISSLVAEKSRYIQYKTFGNFGIIVVQVIKKRGISMDLERIEQQFAFCREIDKEKMIMRQTYRSDGQSKENDAEHAWHMAIMAILLSEYANEKIDVLKTVTMLLIHDIVEIDAGDTYAYDSEAKKSQRQREEKAANRIFGLLPEDQQKQFRAIWEEFEACETPEAKFARAMDNIQPIMLNALTNGKSWQEKGVHLSQILNRNMRTEEGAKELWKYAYANMLAPNVEKGRIKDGGMLVNNIVLNNGVTIPQIGIGVFLTPQGEVTENSVRWALEAGYRHVDTAMIYENEEDVGNAIKAGLVAREDIFITTKLWNEDIRQGRAREAFFESLKRLQTDYVDLYLIHWPATGYEEAWKVMEELYKEGRIKAIGVSNFQIHHLEQLEKIASVVPAVNQIESHPYFTNQEVIDYCKEKNIAVEVWSPLGGTGGNLLEDETLRELAAKYGKTPAQIVIRWDIQREVIVLPKSVHRDRIISNLDVFDFELEKEDMERIDRLNKDMRIGAHPDTFTF